jgi:hypothetical protein
VRCLGWVFIAFLASLFRFQPANVTPYSTSKNALGFLNFSAFLCHLNRQKNIQTRTDWPKFAKQLSIVNFTKTVSTAETEFCDLSPVLHAHLFYLSTNLRKTILIINIVAIKLDYLLSGKCHENLNYYLISIFRTANLCCTKMCSRWKNRLSTRQSLYTRHAKNHLGRHL